MGKNIVTVCRMSVARLSSGQGSLTTFMFCFEMVSLSPSLRDVFCFVDLINVVMLTSVNVTYVRDADF